MAEWIRTDHFDNVKAGPHLRRKHKHKHKHTSLVRTGLYDEIHCKYQSIT